MRKITMLVIAAFAVTSAAAQFNPQQPIPADKDVRTEIGRASCRERV